MNRVIIIILYLSFISIMYAQKLGIPEIEYFNRRQYGGATQNWKVSQSEEGLMYFANNNGLLEYDGVGWSLHNEMNAGIVRSVKCIGDKIYVGTNNDFGFFEYDSLNHFMYTSLAVNNELKDLGDVWTINKWNDKIVFHTEAGIVLYESGEEIIIIPSISRFISCFIVNEMLLVQDEQKGLHEVRGTRIFPVSGGEQLAELNVSSIIALSDREMLISTMTKGLFIWDLNEVKTWDGPVNELLRDANVFCGQRYNEDILLFGTIQNGLVIVNNMGELVMEIDKDKGLMNNTILGLFVDKEGGVWCGLDNGIARISLNNNISFISGYYNLGTGYVQERYGNDWFFGTNQAVFKISDKEFKNPLKDRDSFTRIKGTDGQVWSFFKDDRNLLCGHNLGVFEIVGDGSRLLTPSSVNGVWNFRKVPNRDDYMVCGTYNGLILFEKKNGRWNFKQHIEGFNESSRFIEWDQSGRLWISHGFKGVYCLNFSNDYSKVDKVTRYTAEEFSGVNNMIVSEINEQIIIIGSSGLYIVSEQGDINRFEIFDHFFTDHQYPSNIKEDAFKNLWLFYPDFVEVLRYLEDGTYKKISLPFIPLEKKLVNGFESIYISDKENVFFGIEDGYAHYVMQDYNNFRIPFNVHLRMFRGRTDSLVYTLHQSEKENFKQTKIPTYEFKKNYFVIDYAATFFSDKDLDYSTYLSGFDDEPTDWGKATRREFTKLREGDYYFTVKARNRFGVQSLPLTFQFKVSPPWHRHVYAKVAYLIMILIIVSVVTLVFNKRIEASRQKEKLKARQRYLEKEEQLTSEALRAEKEVIKMRNDKLRSEMKFKEDELAGLTVHIIQKNDLLSELQGQLIRIKKIKTHSESERKIDNLIKKIRRDIENESNWVHFEKQFEQVHHSFLSKLLEKHNDLTDKEKKLCAYVKMGMASKEIASLMNISTRSVENNRYKLRQKLGLQSGDDLGEYIASF